MRRHGAPSSTAIAVFACLLQGSLFFGLAGAPPPPELPLGDDSITLTALSLEPRPVADPESVQRLIVAMNEVRVAHGLTPLRLNDRLSRAAEDRAADMLKKHYFEHVSPEGIDPFTWVDREHYNYQDVGENLATGYPTAASVVQGWMNSPSHRSNVLGAAYVDVGIAIADVSPVSRYEGPLVVCLYGREMKSSVFLSDATNHGR